MNQKQLNKVSLFLIALIYIGAVAYLFFGIPRTDMSTNIIESRNISSLYTSTQTTLSYESLSLQELIQMSSELTLQAQEKAEAGNIQEAKEIYTQRIPIDERIRSITSNR